MYETVAILALLVALYSMVAGRLERTLIGGPILFVAVGFALGNRGLEVIDLEVDGRELEILAELTLALLLFVDASRADLHELARVWILPRRMLLFGLPGTVIMGLLVGIPLLGDSLPLIGVALLAAILAPTDAALGKAVVSDPTVPNRLRTTLNAESGLNDGLCVPIFLAILAFATNTAGERSFGGILLHLLIEEVGIGVLVAAAVVGLACLLIGFASARRWESEEWRPMILPMLALTCFCTAQAIGGSGFVAAFVGGLIFAGIMGKRSHAYSEAAEAIGSAVAMITWIVFGATVIGSFIHLLSWQIVVYSVLSLTVVRMLPIWLSLIGTETTASEKLFLGWFGPRGVASIVFAIMAFDAGVPGGSTFSAVVACTILFSIIAHGLSAKPFAALLAARLKQGGKVETMQ